MHHHRRRHTRTRTRTDTRRRRRRMVILRTDAIITGIRTGTRTDTDVITLTGLTTRHRRRACRAVFPTREAAARRRKAPNNALNRRIKSIPAHGRAIIARTYLLRTGAYVSCALFLTSLPPCAYP